MLSILLSVLLLVASTFLIWRQFLRSLFAYRAAVKIFGKQHVGLIYRPFTFSTAYYKQNAVKYGHPQHLEFELIKRNPNLKIIIRQFLLFYQNIILDKDLIKQVANTHVYNLLKLKLGPYNEWMVMGMPFYEGQQWKNCRKELSAFFHFENLKKWEDEIKKVIEGATKDLDKRDVDLFRFGAQIGAETVQNTLFGQRFDEVRIGDFKVYEELEHMYADYFAELKKLGYYLRFLLFGNTDFDSYFQTKDQRKLAIRIKQFYKVVQEYILQQKAKWQNGQKVPPFIETYFNSKTKYEPSVEIQMIKQLMMFLIAGQDTTGAVIQNCIYILGEHPQYQQMLRKQLSQTQNVHQHKELNNFINETMRILPGGFQIIPRSVKSDINLNGWVISPGCLVTIGLQIIQNNPKYFENPKQFNPDRFNQPCPEFMPFSTGPRNCIGQHLAMMEIRLTMKKILSEYRILRNETKFIHEFDIFICRAVNGHLAKFQKIQ